MTSQSKAILPGNETLSERDLADYGVARLRDQMYQAVLSLWRRRRSEGVTQKQIAEAIRRDPAWVSRNLRAPGNWTLKTAGELIQALDGEAEVKVFALEDPLESPPNHNAYDGYGVITGGMGYVSITAPEFSYIRTKPVINDIPKRFPVGGVQK